MESLEIATDKLKQRKSWGTAVTQPRKPFPDLLRSSGTLPSRVGLIGKSEDPGGAYGRWGRFELDLLLPLRCGTKTHPEHPQLSSVLLPSSS